MLVVDSHFLGSKSAKCMEIVSNPAIMDASHTMASYGPSSVCLAVIALLLWGALAAMEIEKAHRTLATIHICVCVQKRCGENYLCLMSMIYHRPFKEETGDTINHQIHCIQRKDGKHQHRDQETIRTNTEQELEVKVSEELCSKYCRCGT